MRSKLWLAGTVAQIDSSPAAISPTPGPTVTVVIRVALASTPGWIRQIIDVSVLFTHRASAVATIVCGVPGNAAIWLTWFVAGSILATALLAVSVTKIALNA